MVFRDRSEAGRYLAQELTAYAGRNDVIVLGLPRGGVPVAYEVARALEAPLDVLVVRKLGLPQQPELAMGAVAGGGAIVLDEDLVSALRLPASQVDAVVSRERAEVERREREYRGDRPAPAVHGRIVLLVDDGLATGSTLRAAVQALRRRAPARIVVAVPVGASDSCRSLEADADEVVCAWTPQPFQAVGLWYEDFAQTSDDEVRDLIARAAAQRTAPASAAGSGKIARR
jgi:predicted phosphoribosyltransferase